MDHAVSMMDNEHIHMDHVMSNMDSGKSAWIQPNPDKQGERNDGNC